MLPCEKPRFWLRQSNLFTFQEDWKISISRRRLLDWHCCTARQSQFLPSDLCFEPKLEPAHLQEMFQVFSEMSALNPDPFDEQADDSESLHLPGGLEDLHFSQATSRLALLHSQAVTISAKRPLF
mmetsp:Transcript_19745/g.23312  ORF Transcript_19745/g.23312 Transcript_19745/m.23312 type:complete len:125 (+) Transcript_19745:69-443(+)